MKKIKVLTLLIVTILLIISSCRRGEVPPEFRDAVSARGRSEVLFDAGWRFHRGDTLNAETMEFNDSAWRAVELPHDWSIEDLPGKTFPVDSASVGGIDAGYMVGGTGWYRKTFTIPASLKNRHFQLRFDGVYMNADVWINGQHLGTHPYGYTTFFYDITDNLKPGSKNIIAVKVRNEGRNSRWYSGSGIYRHVWLTIYAPLHLDTWKTFITTVSADSSAAVLRIRSGFVNNSKMVAATIAVTAIYDPKGRMIASSEQKSNVGPGEEGNSESELRVQLPELWSPHAPRLYNSSVDLYVVDREGRRLFLDRTETRFGIRTLSVSAAMGLKINGKRVLLKGGCMHHDNGPLGSAAYDRAEERRVELMKASGFNAIRCSHNPPSPAFLDACDRLGMLVIDEAFDMWKEPKNPDDYHQWFSDWWQKDIESMVLRDRNHPSVIFWSIGNEIPESGKPEGAKLAHEIAARIRELDTTRFLTSAVNGVGPGKDPYFSALDICGYNYEKDKYVSDHRRVPSRIIFGSESFALESFSYWMGVVDNPWVIGDFVWTGFDYLGEASIGWLGYPHEGSFYPWTYAYCGDIDICGFKRPQSFYRDVLWNNKPTISLFVHPPAPSFPLNPKKEKWSKWEWHDVVPSWNWNGNEEKNLMVDVYSSCQEAELFLNGRSMGRKKTSRNTEWTAQWDIKYVPGTLEVKGYDNGKVAASSELRTAGPPVKINLNPDRKIIRSGRQDLSFVTVELTDTSGVRDPEARNLIKFSISGPGTILAVGSSDPFGNQSFKRPYRRAYQGRCIVIIKGEKQPGQIRLKAASEGIGSAETIINNM